MKNKLLFYFWSITYRGGFFHTSPLDRLTRLKEAHKRGYDKGWEEEIRLLDSLL